MEVDAVTYAANATQATAFGNGASKPLSGYYATLAAAQADYPAATSLTDELDWAIIQKAFNSTATSKDQIWIRPGAFIVNVTVAPGAARHLVGAGMGITTLRWNGASAGTVLYAPGGAGSIDGITVDGDSTANVNGIVGSASVTGGKPYGCSWGAYEIKNCPGIGLHIEALTTSGIYYCDFGTAYILTCGIGTLIETSDSTGTAYCNNNHFNSLKAGSCTTAGLRIDRADGLTIDNLRAELCDIGVDVVHGNDAHIAGGWIEASTTQAIQVADNPDVLRFYYGGSMDADPSYTFSNNRSALLPYTNGLFLLAGRWIAQSLEGTLNFGGSAALRKFRLAGVGTLSGFVTDPADTTPDVTNITRFALAYSSSATVTNFDGTLTQGQLLIVVAGNTKGIVQNNANIFLPMGDWKPEAAGEVLVLEYDPTFSKWVEICRSTRPTGILQTNTTSASTTAVTTEETLWTYSLPAAMLSRDGQCLRVTAWGTTAANANSKHVRLYFGATPMVSRNTTAFNGAQWRAVFEIVRTGATSQAGTGTLAAGAPGAVYEARTATPAESLAAAVTIKMTGQNTVASAGDITFSGAIVELL